MPTPAPQILQTLARLDPDFPNFAAALPPEVARMEAALPPALSEDVLALLRAERPELAPWLDAQSGAPAPADHLGVGLLGAAGILTPMLFLLRAHIQLTRTPDGKWDFQFEHKPADNDLLQKVLDTLKGFLGGTGAKAGK